MTTAARGQHIPIAIEDEMRQSYMDYAMSVIIGRALPDARDGLKPVQRRVLYAMRELDNDWNRPYKKSARIVGDVIGKYHPHGDAAVYEAIVRMAQDFSMRYPLVDGQGNFGSVDGDPPAAMRYTEIRLARIAAEMLQDIERDTVDFLPNYDDTLKEPVVLPSRLPNLLVNGASGIAVGMSTSIPPHNLSEVVDGLLALLRNPDITIDELMESIPGPDFPTAGFICGRGAIREAYHSGRAVLRLRARCQIEVDEKRGRRAIVVTELPYQVNKAKLQERIAELVRDKRVEGIAELRDESDRHGMRVVIELRREAVPEVVLNQLYRHTSLEERFSVILLAIVDKRPRILNLKELLQVFLDHRREVVVRRTRFDLRKAEERLHVLEGLKIALDHLDAVIALIRAAAGPAEARRGLVDRFSLSERQAQAILDMRLQRLTSMERDKILEEREEVLRQIERFRQILADPREVDAVVARELEELRDAHGDRRRTEIVTTAEEPTDMDLVADEEMVVTLSRAGYVKRTPLDVYRAQNRGGKGRRGAALREDDVLEHVFVASTHAFVLFFTNRGKVYCKRVYQLPAGGPAARGQAAVNFLRLEPEEKVSSCLAVRDFDQGGFIFFATRKGVVKRTDLSQFANIRASGLIALRLKEGDEVIGVRHTDGSREVILSTRKGKAIRFAEDNVRPMGRNAAGVRGIDLRPDDVVVSVDVVEPDATVLSVSALGYGKRTPVEEYRLQGRGGGGIRTMRVTDKTGPVVGVRLVREADDVLLMTKEGTVIRIAVKDIRVMGRDTQGVRLIQLEEGAEVVAVAVAEPEDTAEDRQAEQPESA